MKYRIFLLNNRHCIVHYPEKPNGFGILIIGDKDQYVDGKGSSWMSQENKSPLLQSLLNEGYLLFYPDLSFNHMGNSQAIELTKLVYEYVKRHEIINHNIHIIIEGIGALLLSPFLVEYHQYVRSILFINPIFSLDWMKEQVKDQPFLYRKFLQEIRDAYTIDEDECEQIIANNKRAILHLNHPFKIIHILEHGMKDERWIKNYKKLFGETDRIHVLLREKRSAQIKYALQLFKQAEHFL
ncbi:hydrolase [Fervidibacillus halotolerans]|uniref:Hydrolase n=1 Tax=Fervidibacillus halotolerans TaxID=2980027 RepID=A0A9E8M080_9BACI|nr:hydrolase [Fervidibacillus halotolerans]WAA13058.1 hydrolase [Fervidibacillus halotolerans]